LRSRPDCDRAFSACDRNITRAFRRSGAAATAKNRSVEPFGVSGQSSATQSPPRRGYMAALRRPDTTGTCHTA
jgi:hypothetical protein